MSSLEEIRDSRLQKRESIIQSGRSPYPRDGELFVSLETLRDSFAKYKKSKKISIAGRIVAFREHGKSFFADLYDGTGTFQIFGKLDEMKKGEFARFMETADIGDIIAVEGTAFITKKKEKSILCASWIMLSKSIRPLPEKWHGLQDVEERFRKRYLDLLMNKEVRARFSMRSDIIGSLRRLLDKDGFMEVETPLLHPVAGGALARPFVTHHGALDHDFYLRIAPELYLKRLLVGGIPKVYEIGRNFRNEGIDMTHNPEFTMLELYEAFKNASSHMVFLETLFKSLVKQAHKGAPFVYGEEKISFTKKFERVSFAETLKRFALIPDYDAISENELGLRARQLGVDSKGEKTKGKIADEIFKKVCRPKIIQPTFIVDIPQDISPLAKAYPDKKSIADRYLLIIGGLEIANGFSELNDPIEQEKRFRAQEAALSAGDDEVTRMDEEFLEALEYGMPPAAGLGIGIDRLVMLFTDQRNIREVVLFPTLRPR
ncbi:MAG: lysine--tRNA ligase [Candidatus Niyogibacteria bacterium CG10_big_fil_rev_8_21_14_0_10_46_36]|uniref:Lysine--tRNA ligase n=1 Tax=Candidatus Niyogibacteria bacterium CG10_big_fil_rev_8_21_14_0_10_46_36 TaxID=1974726 RepID=A0A2H0TE86_9BACT|nr:MAG: lysine--tRNA ligase [Candidatus Niyogibacteria bacterium CG10_big_fil_rev_8_21_14_0_10_46_36]